MRQEKYGTADVDFEARAVYSGLVSHYVEDQFFSVSSFLLCICLKFEWNDGFIIQQALGKLVYRIFYRSW